MKYFFLSTVCCFHLWLNAQSPRIYGTWILDNAVYTDGKDVAINHHLYAVYLDYTFKSTSILILNQVFDATYSDQTIKTKLDELLYWFERDYLLLQSKSEGVIMRFLKKDQFVKKYPAFKSEKRIVGSETFYVANDIYKPDFTGAHDLLSFVMSQVDGFHDILKSTNNYVYEAEFALTKESKIKDVHIIQSNSHRFDSIFLEALSKSEPFFDNKEGVDFIVKFYFDFRDPERHLSTDQKPIQEFITHANSLYKQNKFNELIMEFEKVKTNEFESFKSVNPTWYERTMKQIGIAYLATNNSEKACELFNKLGGLTHFPVRNYLINFCNSR